jgi:putative addiction module component (TIGR02574 family)
MHVDIHELLRLPPKKRKEIAEQLWESLSGENTLSEEDKDIVELLDNRWAQIQSGKSKLYSPAEMQKIILQYRNRKSIPGI